MITAALAALATLIACRAVREPSAELWLGGDVNLGDGGQGQLQGMGSMVQGAAGIVNLEGPVSERLPQDRLRLWNAPSALAALEVLNVKVAGIANNHAADAGDAGPRQSASYLREHGIVPAGEGGGPALIHINGITVAVTAHDLTGGVPLGLPADLAAARQSSNVLVAAFHVTGPPSYLPTPELKQAVEMAYHAGANVIVAHGTHAIGPVERRSHAVIAWGLGNVAFACDCTREEDAVLLRVTVQQDKVVSARVLPLRAGVNHQRAEPASDPGAIFDLIEAIGSTRLRRAGKVAEF